MRLLRLSSLTARPLRRSDGRCAACDKPLAGEDTVCIHGALFHSACAYYKARGRRGTDEGRNVA